MRYTYNYGNGTVLSLIAHARIRSHTHIYTHTHPSQRATQDVQDEVNEAVQIWRGLSALPVPEPEPEPEPQPGPPPPESPTAAAAERVSGEQPWGGCAEDGCLDEDEARYGELSYSDKAQFEVVIGVLLRCMTTYFLPGTV